MIAPALDGVPSFLVAQPRWLFWRAVTRVNRQTGETTTTKVPLAYRDPKKPCDAHDPKNWTDYPTIVAALRRTPGAWDGPGFDLGIIEALGEVCLGLDLDTCLAEGVLAAWAMPFLQAIPTYAEASPGGAGIKLYARIKLADLPAARRLLDIPEVGEQARTITLGERLNGQHAPGAQLFLTARYFAVTGQRWPSAPEEVALLDLPQIAALAALFGPGQQRASNGRQHTAGGEVPPGAVDSPALQARLQLAFQRSPELQARWAGDTTGMHDSTGSAFDLAIVSHLRFHGFTEAEACLLASRCPYGTGTKHPQSGRHWRRCWERAAPDAASAAASGATGTAGESGDDWPWADAGTAEAPDVVPDLSVLRLNRRPAPRLPLEVLGAAWWDWVKVTADAAACPVDYVALPLLAAASTLIGNARWAQAWPGWREPPHLWTGTVGDSGAGKSPGAD